LKQEIAAILVLLIHSLTMIRKDSNRWVNTGDAASMSAASHPNPSTTTIAGKDALDPDEPLQRKTCKP
jgi:hypothetical protein